MQVYTVVHLVPYDGIGGVETAARTMTDVNVGNIRFSVKYIFPGISKEKHFKSLYNPFKLISYALSFRKNKINILIVSLWRSLLIGIIVKIIKPNIKLVTFLHSEKDFHLLDYCLHRISIMLSCQIWSDSDATKKSRLSISNQSKCKIISFVTKAIYPLPQKHVSPVFIYWGRIEKYKGISRAIIIFAEIIKKHPNARFIVVGPDGGSLNQNIKECISIGILESVIFKGSASFDEIISYSKEASFYLQTSLIEGMALSVIEAMQLGLVPIVTPVGEIIYYCNDGSNAVIVETDKKVVEDVLILLESNDRYQKMRSQTIATWKDKLLYKDSVLDACKQIIENNYLKF